MQNLVKEVLSLKKGVDAAKWVAAEQNIVQNMQSLNSQDFSTIVKHFGEAQQGSQSLWTKFDSRTLNLIPNCNVDQTINLFHGFGKANNYVMTPALNQLMVKCFQGVGEYLIQQENEKDPYYSSKMMNKIEASYPPRLREMLRQYSSEDWSQDSLDGNKNVALVGDFKAESQGDKIVADEKANQIYQEWKKAFGNEQQSKNQPFRINPEDFIQFK